MLVWSVLGSARGDGASFWGCGQRCVGFEVLAVRSLFRFEGVRTFVCLSLSALSALSIGSFGGLARCRVVRFCAAFGL